MKKHELHCLDAYYYVPVVPVWLGFIKDVAAVCVYCHKGSANIASFYLFLICRITSEDIKNQESKLRSVPCLSSFSRFGCDIKLLRGLVRSQYQKVSNFIILQEAGALYYALCSHILRDWQLKPSPVLQQGYFRVMSVPRSALIQSEWISEYLLECDSFVWLLLRQTRLLKNRVSPPTRSMFAVLFPQLCLHSSMFPQLYVPTVLCSHNLCVYISFTFPQLSLSLYIYICSRSSLYILQFYIPTAPCSHSSIFPQLYVNSIFPQLYVNSAFPQLWMSTVLCSNSSMFPQLCIPTVLCSHSSAFPQFYVLTAQCSHSSIFPQLCIPIALYSHSFIFLQFYVPTALCSNSSAFP